MNSLLPDLFLYLVLVAAVIPDLKEYFIGDGILRASPKDLVLLERMKQDDPDLARILNAFENPRERERMNNFSWKWIDGQIEHRVKVMRSGVYFLVFGVRGMGKSETLQTIGLRIADAFEKFLGIEVEIGFARNASDINTILSDATKEAVVIVVLGDEAEKERGMGANTEEGSLIDNLETIRVLLHTVGRATINLKKVRGFARQCDFILRTIYQDRKKRLNWCLLYVYDDDTDKLIPLSMVGVPLHEDEELREVYSQIKEDEQREFTMARGRRSNLRKRLKPFIDIMYNIAIEDDIRIVRERDFRPKNCWTELRPILLMDERIPAGDTLVDDEPKMVCQAVIMRLGGYFKDKPVEEEKDLAFEWGQEFTWRDEISTIIKKHGEYAKYYTFFSASEIELLSPNKDSIKFSGITKKSKSQNYSWLRRMKKDENFQGWIKEMRARLHERYLAAIFSRDGWDVIEKAKVEINDIEYEEDLLIMKDGLEFYINAKCGSGARTYVKEEYTTTYLIKHTLKKAAFLLYTDLETGVHMVYRADERFSVGNGEGAIASTRNLEKIKNPSTPFLTSLAPSMGNPDKKKTRGRKKRSLSKGKSKGKDKPVTRESDPTGKKKTKQKSKASSGKRKTTLKLEGKGGV